MKKNPYPGKFIVFEGLDGSGQSTQAAKLVDFLNESGQKLSVKGVELTKEPTGNLIGGLIRSQLNHDWNSSPECLQLLFSADRAHHLEKEIIPLLDKGVNVVCDRYFFSTIAYGSLGADRDWLLALNQNFLLPDTTFLLKVSPQTCIERIQRSRYGVDLFEQEDTLTKVWENFKKLAADFENTYVVNGEEPVDSVHKEIINILTKQWQNS